MVQFLCYFVFINARQSLVDAIRSTNDLHRAGNLEEANKLYMKTWADFSEVELFQSNYIDFLMMIGKYKEIIEMKNMKGEENKRKKMLAQECLQKLATNNPQIISTLIDASPDFYEAVVAAAVQNLRNMDFSKTEKHLLKAEHLQKDSRLVQELKGQFLLVSGKIQSGVNVFKSLGNNRVADSISRFYTSYKSLVSSTGHPAEIYRSLVQLYNGILEHHVTDSYYPSVFDFLFKKTAQAIVAVGCKGVVSGTLFYSYRVLQFDTSDEAITNHIKAFMIESRFEDAETLKRKYHSRLGKGRLTMLDSYRSLVEKRFEEERSRERARRAKEEEEQRQRRERSYRNNATNKAGQDFLDYYKTLGASPRSTPAELKKAHRKKCKEAIRKSEKIKDLPQNKKDEELKKVNKAYQILSETNSKAMYDQGIDPEAAPQQNQSHSYGNYEDENMNDIFEAFFGGGGGGRSHRRTQYIFL